MIDPEALRLALSALRRSADVSGDHRIDLAIDGEGVTSALLLTLTHLPTGRAVSSRCWRRHPRVGVRLGVRLLQNHSDRPDLLRSAVARLLDEVHRLSDLLSPMVFLPSSAWVELEPLLASPDPARRRQAVELARACVSR